MGVDVKIYAKAKQPELTLECELPRGYELKPVDADAFAPEGSTHEVDTLARYYGPGYERGPWAEICAALMLLHACPEVERVWYGGDNADEVPECPPARVVALSEHFMEHGNRPYRRMFEAPNTR